MTIHWGSFPFGAPNTERPTRTARGASAAAVVGVYPSAFHISWTAPAAVRSAGRGAVAALAVDVEPTVFWDGDNRDFIAQLEAWKSRVAFIDGDLPGQHGLVSLTSPAANGSSGRTVVERYLVPLGLDDGASAFTDVYPVFVVKSVGPRSPNRTHRGQADAIHEEYNLVASQLGRPGASLPARPAARQLPKLAAAQFGRRLREDLERADPPLVITLGVEVWKTFQQIPQLAPRTPAKTFADLYGDRYGSRGSIALNGQRVDWLPLVHPGLLRGSADRHGVVASSERTIAGWNALHEHWAEEVQQQHDITAARGRARYA